MKAKSIIRLTILLISLSLSLATYPRLAEYNGQGYDVFTGNPLSRKVDEGFKGRNVFKLNYDEGRKTTDDYFYVPKEVEVAVDLSCSFSSKSVEFTGLSGYQEELSAKASVKGSWSGIASKVSFSGSSAYQSMKETLSGNSHVSIMTQALCKLYRGTIMEGHSALSEEFKMAIAQTLEDQNNGGWVKFVKNWGTHYASVIEYGAAALQETVFKRESFQELKSSGLDVSASISARAFGSRMSASSSYSMSESQAKNLESAISKTTASYIGLEPPQSGDANEWLANIKNSKPVPLKFELKPISDVFTLHYFSGIYTQVQLNNMIAAFAAAVYDIAITMNSVPNLDAILEDVNSTVIQTVTYGLNKTDSTAFEDSISQDLFTKVKQIRFCYGWEGLLGGIGMTITDGGKDVVKQNNGICNDEDYHIWNVPEGHRIDKIVIGSGHYINFVEFYTDKGAKSPVMGQLYSNRATFDLTQNQNLVGFFGTKGSDVIRTLGFYFRNIEHPQIGGITSDKTEIASKNPNGIYREDPERATTGIRAKEIEFWGDDIMIGFRINLEEDGQLIRGTLHGKYGGNRHVLTLPDSRINKIKIYTGAAYIRGIQFFYEDGTSSQLFGSTVQWSQDILITGQLTGAFSYTEDGGNGYVTGLGFIFNNRQ